MSVGFNELAARSAQTTALNKETEIEKQLKATIKIASMIHILVLITFKIEFCLAILAQQSIRPN